MASDEGLQSSFQRMKMIRVLEIPLEVTLRVESEENRDVEGEPLAKIASRTEFGTKIGRG